MSSTISQNSYPGTTVYKQYVYDVNTMSWVAEQQPIINGDVTVAGAVTVSNFPAVQPVSGSPTALTAVSGLVNSTGDNTVITPSSGKKIRLYYFSYNAAEGPVEVALKFGSGTEFLRNYLAALGSTIAKDFGDLRCLEGATNEALNLNLSTNVDVIWNAFYVEI